MLPSSDHRTTRTSRGFGRFPNPPGFWRKPGGANCLAKRPARWTLQTAHSSPTMWLFQIRSGECCKLLSLIEPTTCRAYCLFVDFWEDDDNLSLSLELDFRMDTFGDPGLNVNKQLGPSTCCFKKTTFPVHFTTVTHEFLLTNHLQWFSRIRAMFVFCSRAFICQSPENHKSTLISWRTDFRPLWKNVTWHKYNIVQDEPLWSL